MLLYGGAQEQMFEMAVLAVVHRAVLVWYLGTCASVFPPTTKCYYQVSANCATGGGKPHSNVINQLLELLVPLTAHSEALNQKSGTYRCG